MKKYIRLTSLLLVLLLLASLWGCSMPGIGDDSGVATTEKATTTAPPEDIAVEETAYTEGVPDTTEYIGVSTEPVPETTPDPPATTDLGYIAGDPAVPSYNTTIGVLAWKDSDFTEFEADRENSGDSVLSTAIYERLIKTEETLGVDIEFTYIEGNTSNAQVWNVYITNIVSAAAREYDFIAGGSLGIAQNAVNGLLCNLLSPEFEAFNPEMPYYFASYSEDARIGSALYFTTGSFSVNALTSIYVCFANTDRLEAYNLGDPRGSVMSGEWTLDKFLEMCNGAYVDDGDGLKNVSDSFGYITSRTRTDAWYYGSGARFLEIDGSGSAVFSPMYDSEDVIILAERLASFFHTSADGFISSKADDAPAAFASGRTLFVTEPLGMALGEEMKDFSKNGYYLLPIPKYSLNQERYYSTLGNQHTLFAITLDCPDRERAAAVLEYFARYGYEKIMPAVYGEATGKNYEFFSPTNDGSMFDVIRESVVYDHARVFCQEFNGQNADFRAVVFDNEAASLPTRIRQVARVLEKKLIAFNDKFAHVN